ncbi:MAG: hypothetical protein DI533_20105 [Cereibacter sphaeroides]|uniref:Uncharacterized protein n=1 Tax=Cereibacter sphaeroides TaxID=1063 RepID=A0A2W5RZ67_CERSP|nr:MAG: hypothetical protein DI533_20105 [Cereibacter sphaeroides]
MLKKLMIRAITRILQKFFVGKRLYRMGDLDGQKAILNYGRIVGFDRRRLELSYLDNGGSIRDARRVHIRRLSYDRRLKNWVYYD